MQETEVTQKLWEEVMGENPSIDKTWSDLPVSSVSWYDCQEFIEELNELTGRQYRLPTEAEWEYAAKGGKNSNGFVYSGSNNIKDVAWFEENSSERLHVVKELNPNELGLYDMSGNVEEWSQDIKANYRIDNKGSVNPKGADNGCSYIVRGGSLYSKSLECRTSKRFEWPGEQRWLNIGLRLVRTK